MRLNTSLAALAILGLLASPALAAFSGPGADAAQQSGFKGPTSGAMAESVAKAKTLGDDSPVILTGHITSKLAGKKDDYMFRDDTGEIRVDIDHKYFPAGVQVTPETKVRITGKVDKDLGKDMEIDVKSLEIVN